MLQKVSVSCRLVTERSLVSSQLAWTPGSVRLSHHLSSEGPGNGGICVLAKVAVARGQFSPPAPVR